MSFENEDEKLKIMIKKIYDVENNNLRTGKSNEEMIKAIVKIIEEEVDNE